MQKFVALMLQIVEFINSPEGVALIADLKKLEGDAAAAIVEIEGKK